MADEEEAGYTWETAYERTWEVLQEDETGSLEPSVLNEIRKAKRKRLLERKKNVKLGIMRHVFVVVDLSQSMEEKDLHPTRHRCLLRLLDTFIDEFFDQNPISQLGFIITQDKRAEKISDLTGNARKHKEALSCLKEKACIGEPSLQNSLELAMRILRHIPSHASREILIIMGSLATCDPTNINSTIELLKRYHIRCSVVGLAAEVHVCKRLSTETKGFPEHKVTPIDSAPSMCACHSDIPKNKGGKTFTNIGYFCPQCESKYCSLPIECKICGLQLVSGPQLARSYQHLFPLEAFREEDVEENSQEKCFGCFQLLESKAYTCGSCKEKFCIDCDVLLHESIQTCPSCTF